MRWYLACRPDEEGRIFRLFDLAAAGSPGHGAVHLLISSTLEIFFAWDSEQEGWIRAGLPPLRMMAEPVQHFRSAIFSAWQDTVATDLCNRKGFREKFGFHMFGSHQLLVCPHLRERDNMF